MRIDLAEGLMIRRLVEASNLEWRAHREWAERNVGNEWVSGHDDRSRAALLYERIGAEAGRALREMVGKVPVDVGPNEVL